MDGNNKKILVTGGAGYIGSHVCNLLLDKGSYVFQKPNMKVKKLNKFY